MERVKEIGQLKRKEEILENINEIQKERIKLDSGMPMLILSSIAGVISLFLVVSMFGRRS